MIEVKRCVMKQINLGRYKYEVKLHENSDI